MTNSLGNSISRSGLVGEWLLDGNALDTSGNGNNGTATNVTYVKTNRGYQSQAGSFNGSSSYVTISDTTTLYCQNEMTYSGWFKVNNTESYHGKDNVSNREWILSIGTSTLYVMVFTSNSVYSLASVPSQYFPTVGVWTHIVFTRNSSGVINIYKDGVLRSGATSPISSNNINNTTTAIEFGRRNYGPQPGYLNGQNQLNRLYNRVLTQEEIQLLYLEGQKLLGPTNIAKYPKLFEGLVGYFENPTSTELWNIATGVKSTYVGGTNTTDNLGISRAISNPNYTWSSITYTTGYTFENSGSGWSIVTSPTGLSATGINRTTTLRNVFLFNRTLSADEVTLLQNLCNSDYIYPSPSYDLPNLRDGLIIDFNGSYSGNTYYDNSGNGYTFTGTNITNNRIGKIKEQYLGTANNGSIIQNNNLNLGLSPTSTITVNKWIKTGYSGINGNLLTIGTSNNFGFVLTAHNGTYQLNAVKYGIADQYLNSSIGVSSTKYSMVTGVFNNGNFKIYIDGFLKNSGTYLTNPSGSLTPSVDINICVGSGHINYHGGTKIWNRVLSDKEIQALYYSQKTNFVY